MPGGAACAAPPFFIEYGVPAVNIQVKAFGGDRI
jgi:hypothetical protein